MGPAWKFNQPRGTDKEVKALKAACAKYTAETPGRWGKVAAEVGGGKTGDACKKKSKEVK